MDTNDLPPGVGDWLVEAGGGPILRFDRQVSRREGYVVEFDTQRSPREAFFRLERTRIPDNPWSLAKEAGIVTALADTAVPVPAVYAANEPLGCVLFERVRGRADLPNVETRQQHAVMAEFIDIVAELHKLDPGRLRLPAMPQPATAYDCALGEMDLILKRSARFLERHHDPLITYGVDWLRRFAPKSVAKVALVQGDTGPVNFMFDGDHVTAVIDWEWAHLGDPMEDLGNIAVREFWNPSGGLDGLLDRYERKSGIPVDIAAVRYYRVQQNMRGMVPVAEATINANPQEPLAWYLAYRYTGDRATCEAIAEAMGIALDRPEFPSDAAAADPLEEAARWALANDIAPQVKTPIAGSRVRDVDVLLRCMGRVNRFGAAIDAVECQELGVLLGSRPATAAEGLSVLDGRIADHTLPDEAIVRYLARRAYRLEWLYQPSTELYPDRRWAALQ